MGISWYIYLVLALFFRFSESRSCLTLLYLVSYIPLLLRIVLYYILIEGYYRILFRLAVYHCYPDSDQLGSAILFYCVSTLGVVLIMCSRSSTLEDASNI
ncbi:uncharacterized protein BDV14DRAFT_167252 [Aspergillus stella-maris]|uniref:uncharacterized protein n=1 Tax=Aspergillus stella-maris TaxID=1810926 RepID=UPI003CCD73BF